MPAQAIYFAEPFNSGGGWWRAITDVTGTTCTASYYREVHNSGINVSYADGHVKWLQSNRAFAPQKTQYTTYLPWYPLTQNVLAGY